MEQKKQKSVLVLTLAILSLAVITVVSLVFTVWSGKPKPAAEVYTANTKEMLLMNTLVRQSTFDDSPEADEKMKQMFDYLDTYEKKVSNYISGSEISQINQNAGIGTVTVSDEIFPLLSRSKELSLQSNGKFDITIGPLTKLWGISEGKTEVPSADRIQSMMNRVNASKLSLDEEKKTARLSDPYMELDLGAVAKGYACNLARQKYKELGLDNCLLSLGGNIYSFGTRPDGTAFTIGLRDPRGGPNDILGTFAAPDKVVSTSGDYERYFDKDGIRYHHILDPKTGYPASADLISVTVISEDGLLADYNSTYLFMAGKEELLRHLNEETYEVIAVDNQNQVYLSKGMINRFRLTENSSYKIAE